MGIVLFCFVFFVRIYTFNLKNGKRLIIYFSYKFGMVFTDLFSFFGVLGVLGQPLPLPSPSNSSAEDYSNMMAENPNLDSLFSEGLPVAAPDAAPLIEWIAQEEHFSGIR